MQTNNKKQLNTPILFLTFNRPDLTQRVFDEIKKAQPKQLFWVSDGARNEEEKKLVEETRKIIDQVDWNCEVKTNFSDKNLGCKIRVSSGIDWFFDNVEQGIILEDDCLPDQSFFWFCEELLNKYKNNETIMHIGGTNFQNGKQRGNASYYFSKYAHIWGWATWKKAWKHYDINLTDSDIDTWDYQWQNSVEKNNGICIIPNKNLVSNIGFDKRATHTTKKESAKANIKTKTINQIAHPRKIEINKKADNYSQKIFFNKNPNLFKKIYIKLKIFFRKK